MRINFANRIELWFYFRVLETGARKCKAPLVCREKAWIGTKFRIGTDVAEAIEDLKYQFRIHRLIRVGSHTLTDY